jgi:F0F1-type ATP synthase beta subunit
MSNQKLRELLATLQEEIQKTDVDAGTRSLIQELDSDIHALLGSGTTDTDTNSVVERARLLEAEFSTSHPVAERFVREIIDTLVRIGV